MHRDGDYPRFRKNGNAGFSLTSCLCDLLKPIDESWKIKWEEKQVLLPSQKRIKAVRPYFFAFFATGLAAAFFAGAFAAAFTGFAATFVAAFAGAFATAFAGLAAAFFTAVGLTAAFLAGAFAGAAGFAAGFFTASFLAGAFFAGAAFLVVVLGAALAGALVAIKNPPFQTAAAEEKKLHGIVDQE